MQITAAEQFLVLAHFELKPSCALVPFHSSSNFIMYSALRSSLVVHTLETALPLTKLCICFLLFWFEVVISLALKEVIQHESTKINFIRRCFIVV